MYRLVASKTFDKSFRKLDKVTRDRVAEWIAKRLVDCEKSTLMGKSPHGKYEGSLEISDRRLSSACRNQR